MKWTQAPFQKKNSFNDSEDDTGPRKIMETRIEKMQEMFNKERPRRIKEQTNRDEQYNN